MSFFDSELEQVGGELSIQQVIEVWGEEFEEILRHSLEQEGYGQSNLSKSIRFTVTPESGGFRFELFFNEYGDYLDEGVRGKGGARKSTSTFNSRNNRGKMWKQNAPASRFKFTTKKPPADALRDWSAKRGISRWAVQEAVFRQGIKPTHWFSKIVGLDFTEDLIEKLEEAGSKQIEIDFANMIKTIQA